MHGNPLAEGLLLTCSFDYLTDTFSNKAFTIYLTVVDFVIPMVPVFYYYIKIATEVIMYYRRQQLVVKKIGMSKKTIKRVRVTE